ncbi:hypothetical protein PFICI_06104 [Pestalotiopsis fici W106-1]|uniref:Uncharacterized protein n=1 Tax=Pestalotiopsis fici (strain W106-1 / CGMCC3.15140) TaxID=1229662 RepID=W3X6S0_PESFW|nr:uncharacterized protein PFICI_06104 [Pestalotiopsis fici W106-1]ETS81102.1 hypothetical protein PFICI_06104 [Pestalotiopsis fici W106-1]
MFSFEEYLSPATTTVLSAESHWISSTVFALLGATAALHIPAPTATPFLIDDGAKDMIIIARSETAIQEAVPQSTTLKDSVSASKGSTSNNVKTENAISTTKNGAAAESTNTATLTNAPTSSQSNKGKPPATSIASSVSNSHESGGGKGQQLETSISRSIAGPISPTVSGSISSPTGHWIPVSIPTALASGAGLYEKHSKIYDDGYRQGYHDGCYDHAYATHPATLGGEYYTGYKKGRDSGIRDCRPLNGNDQDGSGWSGDVLLPSLGSEITLALWLLVMPCVLAFMLHML